MPFTTFKLEADAPLGSAESLNAQTSKLKAAAAAADKKHMIKPTTINMSTTAQPGMSIDAVVISAQDGTVPGGGSVLRFVVARSKVTRDGELNGGLPFDCIDTAELGPVLVPTKQVENNTGKFLAMPRVIAKPDVDFGTTHLLPTVVVSVGYFKNQKDGPDMCAASFPPGTRVKLTGLTFEHGKPDKVTGVEPQARARVKRVDVIRRPSSIAEAERCVATAMQDKMVEKYLALASVPSLGGFEKIGASSPALATDLAEAQKLLRSEVAAGLVKMATRLEHVVAGEGESYATPACNPESVAALRAMAAKLNAAEYDAPLGMLFGTPLEMPMLFQGHKPFELNPILDDPANCSAAPYCARPCITSIAVEAQDKTKTGVVTIFPSIGLTFCGDRALQAAGAKQPAFYNTSNTAIPVCGIRFSLKNLAPMLGTASFSKTIWLCKELLENECAPITLLTDLYPRSGEDAIFQDKSGGSNWASVFNLDLHGALANVSLPLRVEYVVEKYGGGEATISEYEPPDEDKIAAPGQSIVQPSLDGIGVLALSEKTRKINKLMEEHPDLTFCVVCPGVQAAINEDPELLTDHAKAEAWLTAKFQGTPAQVERALISSTLLYAVKPRPTATPHTSEAGSAAEDDDEDDDSEEEEASSPGKAKSSGKKAKEGRKSKTEPY